MAEIPPWLRRGVALRAVKSDTSSPSDGAEDPPPASGIAAGAVDATADTKQLAEGMADVRSLLQRTATAIGAVAAAVLTGLGYTQLHEIFPVPANASEASKDLLVVAMVAAVVGSAWLASRFFSAQRRILVSSDLSKTKDLGWEKNLAQRVLDEHAREEGATSLNTLERRALRLDRVSRRLDPETQQSKAWPLKRSASTAWSISH